MLLDLNPIENTWKLLEINLARKHLRTCKSLLSKIKKEWNAFPKDHAQRMKNCISNVIVVFMARVRTVLSSYMKIFDYLCCLNKILGAEGFCKVV